LVGVAVNVTELPEQTVVAGVVTLTDGVTDGLMVIVMDPDVAVAGDGQAAADVMTQVTIAPLVSVVVVYVALFVPTLVPFTFH
jgi:hypothetical protein